MTKNTTNIGIENSGTLDRTTGYMVRKVNGKKVAVHRLIISAN